MRRRQRHGYAVSLTMFLAHREGDPQGCALSHDALDGYAPVVLFHDAAAD